jgi:cobalamin biosynthesis Mg chelatase CobN
MRICSNCGSEIGPNDDFCTSCGTKYAPLEHQVGLEQGSRSDTADEAGKPTTVAVGTTLEVATERAGAYDSPRQAARENSPASGPEEPAGHTHGAQKPSFASTPSGMPALGTASTRGDETIEQKYLRQTRTATVFIAIIVGIVTVIALIGVIWTATTISKLNSQLNGVSNTSDCESQGGTNPNC